MSQLLNKARRQAGIAKRLIVYPLRCWGLVNLCIYEVTWSEAPVTKPPDIEVEIKRLSVTDEAQLKAVADFQFYGGSRDDLVKFLEAGQDCYIAEHQGQPVACYWRAKDEYYDHVLKRSLRFTRDEEYLLGGYTLPAFRDKGIMSYLARVSADERMRDNPNQKTVVFVRASNRASQRTLEKMGHKRTGRVGFVEVLGIRFSFLVGRGVLPATTKRNFVSLSYRMR